MTDTPDPIAEVVQEPVNETVPPARRASAVLPVLGGIVAAVIGFGLAQVVPSGWPVGGDAATTTTLAMQTEELAALKETVRQLSETETATQIADLAERVAKVEAGLGAIGSVDLAGLTGRVDDLDRRVAELALRPSGAGTMDQAALTALQAAVAELKSQGIPAAALAQAAQEVDAKLADANARIAAITDEANGIARSATQRAALTQILAALDSGAPYASAMANLGDVTLPESLATYAQSGLPSLQSLRDGFPEFARLALEASLQANPGQSWSERIAIFLRVQTGARSLTLREGTDPDALLSQAEAALAKGDVAAALTALDQLPPEGQAAMAAWRETALVRQEAATALQALLAASEL